MNVLPACVHVYHMCAWCFQKPEEDPLELELKAIINHESVSCARTASAQSHQVFSSPAPEYMIFNSFVLDSHIFGVARIKISEREQHLFSHSDRRQMLSCSKAMKLGTVTVPLSLPALASIYPLQFMCQMLNPQDNSVGRPHMYGVTRSGLWLCG